MAVIKRQDVCFGTTYESNGETKKRWNRIGKAFHNDSGQISIRIDMLPGPGWDGWINLFDEKQSEPQQSQAHTQQYNYLTNQSDGLPF